MAMSSVGVVLHSDPSVWAPVLNLRTKAWAPVLNLRTKAWAMSWELRRTAVVVALCAHHVMRRRLPKVVRKAEKEGRVVAVVGRDGVGKSKVCAALLDLVHVGKKGFADKQRLLEPDKGEKKRNFSCYNHIYSQRSHGSHLHLIDTPGHVDRLPLVEQALHASHGAVMVCSVRGGVDAACGRVLAAVEHSRKPSVIFLNGIDNEDGTPLFIAALDALEARLGVRPVVLFAPAHVVGSETGSTLLNVLGGSLCTSRGCHLLPEVRKPKKGSSEPHMTMQVMSFASQLKEQLVETLASVDDEVMEAYLQDDGKVPRSLIDAALMRATAAGKIIPLVAGSAKFGLGVDALEEVVKAFIPGGGGQSLAQEFGIDSRDFSADAPCLGWAFGTRRTSESNLLEVRVLGGTLRPNESLELVGVSHGGVEKIMPKHVWSHSLKGSIGEVKEAGPGDIALVPCPEALGVLRPALQDDDEAWMRRGRCTFALQLEGMDPKSRSHLLQALDVCLEENDGLRLEKTAGEHLLSCMGMFHLDLLRERLATEFKIRPLPLCQPHVTYHVKLNAAARCDNKSGPGPGRASIELIPAAEGSGCQVQDASKLLSSGDVIPDSVPALELGILSALKIAGPGGSQLVDVTAKVLDASLGSAEEALECMRAAIAKTMSMADYTLLEPIVELEVDAPSTCTGSILEDLRNRRAMVMDTRSSQGDNQVVIVSIPLVEILDYAPALAALTEGEGFFTHRLEGYMEVTSLVQKRLVAELTENASSSDLLL